MRTTDPWELGVAITLRPLSPMHFLDGKVFSYAVAHNTYLLTVWRGHCVRVQPRGFFRMARKARAGDRLNRFDASVGLRDQTRQKSRRQRRLIGSRNVALRAVSPIAGKADVAEI